MNPDIAQMTESGSIAPKIDCIQAVMHEGDVLQQDATIGCRGTWQVRIDPYGIFRSMWASLLKNAVEGQIPQGDVLATADVN
jgi:hypothetical protein